LYSRPGLYLKIYGIRLPTFHIYMFSTGYVRNVGSPIACKSIFSVLQLAANII